MSIVIGIDPGARFVGVCVVDTSEENKVLLSSTYVRPDDMPQVAWAVHAVEQVKADILTKFPGAKIGIEDVTSPQAYKNGKLQLLNPSNTIKLAIVVGAFAREIPYAVMVRPGKNGSQEVYPEVLTGVRPKTLPGVNQKAGTRNHERSAFDIALLVEGKLDEGYVLDQQKGLFD